MISTEERLNEVVSIIKRLEAEQEAATVWGAAVGARDEWLQELYFERRHLKNLIDNGNTI